MITGVDYCSAAAQTSHLSYRVLCFHRLSSTAPKNTFRQSETSVSRPILERTHYEYVCYAARSIPRISAKLPDRQQHAGYSSGECIDPEHETGITPAFYLTVDEVIQVASELAQISDEALLSRYEPENMHDLHPIGEWTDCPEIRRELLDDFHALQAFYAVQANAGNAVINYLV